MITINREPARPYTTIFQTERRIAGTLLFEAHAIPVNGKDSPCHRCCRKTGYKGGVDAETMHIHSIETMATITSADYMNRWENYIHA